jgi:hypothetical protein
MGARQMRWARNKREEIRQALGNVCAGYKKRCKVKHNLQFDCITPVPNGHGQWSYDTRTRFYITQLAIDNLQLLCPRCHEAKSGNERMTKHPDLFEPQVDPDNCPF